MTKDSDGRYEGTAISDEMVSDPKNPVLFIDMLYRDSQVPVVLRILSKTKKTLRFSKK